MHTAQLVGQLATAIAILGLLTCGIRRRLAELRLLNGMTGGAQVDRTAA